MIGTRARFTRLAVAAVLVVPAIVASVSPSQAAPSAQDVANAQQHLDDIKNQIAALNEQYNQALYELQQAQQHLDQALQMKQAAEAESKQARARLAKRAIDAYTGMGSQYDALLSANSMTEFSDRLEFLGAVSQTDADLASQADSAAQQFEWASQEYDQAVADHQAKADQLAADKQAAEQKLTEAAQFLADTQAAHDAWVQQQQAALAAPPPPPPPADPPSTNDPASTAPTDPSGGGGGYVPSPNASAATIAVQSAESVIGAPYVFGAAGPSSFDCSGLTMWAWGQAGVSIPHSAAAQWSSLPHVPMDQIVPGDIIYYGNFGPHVAIYVGGGTIVHARHPGPGGEVQYSSLYGYDRPYGAVRPG